MITANPVIAVPPTEKSNPLGLSLFLAGLPVIAWLVFSLNSSLHFLGWSRSPGYLILFCLLGFAALCAYLRVARLQIMVSTGLLFVPVILSGNISPIHEIYRAISLPGYLWVVADFLPLLLGATLVYRLRQPMIVKLIYLLAAASIGSVFLYNAFYPNQHTNFFGGGWTA